jgi:hypothetical protein
VRTARFNIALLVMLVAGSAQAELGDNLGTDIAIGLTAVIVAYVLALPIVGEAEKWAALRRDRRHEEKPYRRVR